jgi:hypothetical protein
VNFKDKRATRNFSAKGFGAFRRAGQFSQPSRR